MCTSGSLRKRSMKPYEAFCQLVCMFCLFGWYADLTWYLWLIALPLSS